MQRDRWRVARADKASVIVDADDYFQAGRLAMLAARHRIMLIGWDFDARIDIREASRYGSPGQCSATSSSGWSSARPDSRNLPAALGYRRPPTTLFRGTTILTLSRLDEASRNPSPARRRPPDRRLPSPEDRGDRRLPRLLRRHRHDQQPLGHAATIATATLDAARRTASPTAPWHDSTTALQGPVAAALGELARERWRGAGGQTLPPLARADRMLARRPRRRDFRNVDVDSAARPATAAARVLEIERALSRPRSPPRAASSTPRASISPRAGSPRRSPAGWREADGPEIVLVNPVARMAGSSRSPWTLPAPACSRCCAARSPRSPPPLPSGHRGRPADLCPCQGDGRRRRGAACRLVQHEQPLDAARHRMRRRDRHAGQPTRDARSDRRPPRRAARRASGKLRR